MTTNGNKQNKFQINVFADFKDAIDTVSQKASSYISLFSDEQKTNKIGCILQQIDKINTVSESYNNINEVFKIYNLNGSGLSTEFQLAQTVEGNLLKSLASRTPMKSRILSGAGVELGFNLVTVFKKQLASGLVSLAIVWEQDSLQESIKQEVFFDAFNIKKSISGKMYYHSLYSDSNLTNNIGRIRQIVNNINVPILSKQYQSSNLIVDIYEGNSLSLPSGSIDFNDFSEGDPGFYHLISNSNFSSGDLSSGDLSNYFSANLKLSESNKRGGTLVKGLLLKLFKGLGDELKSKSNSLEELYFDYNKSNVDLSDSNKLYIPLYKDLNNSNSKEGCLVLQQNTHILPAGVVYTDVTMITSLYKSKSIIKNFFSYNGRIEDLKDVFNNLTIKSSSLASDIVNKASGVLTTIRPWETAGLKQNGRLINGFWMTVGY